MSDREFIAPSHLKVGMHDFTPSMGVDPIERVANHLAASAARTRRLEREHAAMRKLLRDMADRGAHSIWVPCPNGVEGFYAVNGTACITIEERDTIESILSADE